MPLHRRVVPITLGLILAGGLTGAVSGVLAVEAAVLLVMQGFSTPAIAAASGAIGGVFGAVVAPILAWSTLRRVPLGRAIAGIAGGAGLGGAVGVFFGIAAIVPHKPFALHLPPVPQGIVGAFVGAALAAAYLNERSRRPAVDVRAG